MRRVRHHGELCKIIKIFHDKARMKRNAITTGNIQLGIEMNIQMDLGEVKEQVNCEIGELEDQANREMGELTVRLDRIEKETLDEMQTGLSRIEKDGINATKVNSYIQ